MPQSKRNPPKGDEHTDDGDDDEEFDEGETSRAGRCYNEVSGGATLRHRGIDIPRSLLAKLPILLPHPQLTFFWS